MDHVSVLIQIVQEKKLPNDEELAAILSVLHDAGFGQVVRIAEGRVVGHYRDQDGSSTGETFPRNYRSGLVAMCEKEEHQVATSWLDSLWGYVAKKETGIGLVKEARGLIDQSVPLKPIVLTQYGESLREYPPDQRGIYTVHTRDDHPLRFSPGAHEVCLGWVDLRVASSTHNALVCRTCHLRVVIPSSVDTYGALRAHFKEFNS